MLILSIDVGIKNLAYCLFSLDSSFNSLDYTKKKKKENKENLSDILFRIIEWDVIDLFGDKVQVQEEEQVQDKNNKKINKAKNSKKTKKVNASNISLIEVGRQIVYHLEELTNQYKMDIVLIENQISPIASRMKTVQGMLAQYFIMKEVKTIQFISAINKLRDIEKDEIFNTTTNNNTTELTSIDVSSIDETKKKLTYKERKEKSIYIVKKLLEIIPESYNDLFLSKFNSHSKKDDLADCYLQGLWYILKITN